MARADILRCLQEELNTINARIQDLEDEKETIEKAIKILSSNLEKELIKSQPTEEKPAGRFDNLTYGNAAEIILKEAGKPLRGKEIRDILSNSGLKWETKDTIASVYNSLQKDERFKRVGELGKRRWVLKEWGNKNNEDNETEES